MQLMTIVPTSHLKEIRTTSNAYMLLAHSTAEEKYLEYYQNLLGFKVLDNGVAEMQEPMIIEDLVEVAIKLGHVDEIVLPDMRFQADLTVELVQEALQYQPLRDYIDKHACSVMLVPHGYDKGNWFDCLERLVALVSPDAVEYSVGIGRGYGSLAPTEGRVAVAEQVQQIYGSDVPIHLLGLVNPIELYALRYIDVKIRSCDTSLPCVAAYFKEIFRPPNMIVQRPAHWQFRSSLYLTDAEIVIAQFNVNLLERLCNNAGQVC